MFFTKLFRMKSKKQETSNKRHFLCKINIQLKLILYICPYSCLKKIFEKKGFDKNQVLLENMHIESQYTLSNHMMKKGYNPLTNFYSPPPPSTVS